MPDDMIGRQLGSYKVKRMIAKGGMGRVYEAVDERLDRRVAIKVITLDEDVVDEMMTRFEREARVISQLDKHPNIITMYSYDKAEGVHFIAMDFIEGQSLAQYMKAHRKMGKYVDVVELLPVLKQIAAALDFAHQKGVIHRDIKPANIMLEPDPAIPEGMRAILMDFGLVKRVDNTMTQGSAFGTPRYISPEQAISSLQAVAQSDIYSFGVMVYEMLTGEPPFGAEDDTPIGVALSHVTTPPPDPKDIRADLPDAVVPVMMKVLEKTPEQRYQTTKEFVEALEAALSEEDTAQVNAVAGGAGRKTDEDTFHEPVNPNSKLAAPIPVPQNANVITGEVDSYTEDGQKKRSLLPLAIVALIVLGGIVAAIFMLSSGGEEGDTADNDSEQVTSDTDNNDTNSAANNGSDGAEVSVASDGSDGAVELFISDDVLTIRNATSRPIQLLNVSLRNDTGEITLDDYGVANLESWGVGVCGYITLFNITVDNDIRPQSCVPETENPPLRYVSNANFVWQNGSFDVWQNDTLLGTCEVGESCRIEGILQAAR